MKKTLDIKKLVLLNMPYILLGLFATNFGEAWRMAQGADASEKFLSLIAVLPGALESFWPSLHPLDLLVGLCCGGSLRLAVYLKSKNAKKYRHGLEYGSARWGTREDIAPYVDPVFQNNVILTKTESLTMNSRPKDPKTARNKNVLVIGGSGSGKTRFWLKPNLMQMHSSYVVTDPKGTILVECGKMLQRGAPKLGKDGKPMKDKHGKVIYESYRIKVLNTINFKKSMHYKRQVGNVGGYPYWSWYGFDSRVEWCACFVSWCYNQAGKSEPRFAGCEWQGVPWFQSHGQWGARGYNNLAPGDAIFFDWDLDGTADHVGIVIGTDGSRVYTVEGNSGDACKIKSYDLNYQSIKGYGLMNW